MVAETLTPIEEIKSLYGQIKEKTKAIELIAVNIGRSPRSLRNHWFSEFWAIPLEHQKAVKKHLEEIIKGQ